MSLNFESHPLLDLDVGVDATTVGTGGDWSRNLQVSSNLLTMYFSP